MPISYEIFPQQNLLIYVFTDAITITEFFQVGDAVAQDPRYRGKMKIIMDMFSAELDVSVPDLYLAIRKHREARQRGQEVGQTAVVSTNRSLQYLGETLTLLSFDSIANFGIFYNKMAAIRWLKLPEEETLQCWQEIRDKASGIRT